jgi:hypothetical protein
MTHDVLQQSVQQLRAVLDVDVDVSVQAAQAVEDLVKELQW